MKKSSLEIKSPGREVKLVNCIGTLFLGKLQNL